MLEVFELNEDEEGVALTPPDWWEAFVQDFADANDDEREAEEWLLDHAQPAAAVRAQPQPAPAPAPALAPAPAPAPAAGWCCATRGQVLQVPRPGM